MQKLDKNPGFRFGGRMLFRIEEMRHWLAAFLELQFKTGQAQLKCKLAIEGLGDKDPVGKTEQDAVFGTVARNITVGDARQPLRARLSV